MVLSEDLNGFLEGLLHLRLHNLLTLSLHKVLRIVLAHLLVSTRSEADHRRGPRMADIDADQHRPHLIHGFRELQVEQVSLDLRIDLAEDVGSLAHVEFEAIARRDHLRRDIVLVEELLVHPVVVLVAEDDDHDLGVTEVAIRGLHHVMKQLALDLTIIVLGLNLEEVGLLNTNLQHAT